MTAKRFTHKINQLGMQFICYDDKAELLGTFADADGVTHIVKLLNELHEENYKIKSLLLKKVEELNNAYDKSARAGMPTGGIIGELDSFEEICRIMEWIE